MYAATCFQLLTLKTESNEGRERRFGPWEKFEGDGCCCEFGTPGSSVLLNALQNLTRLSFKFKKKTCSFRVNSFTNKMQQILNEDRK